MIDIISCPKNAKTEDEIIKVFDVDDTCMHCDNCIITDGLVICKYNMKGEKL